MKQQYKQYAGDDHARWSSLMKKKTELLANASSDFLKGFDQIRLPEDRIPSFEEVNEVLLPLTGWQYEAGEDGDMAAFFEALSRRVFPSAVQVRPWDELEFCKLPDIFHDVFGHAALLTHPQFAHFLESLGRLGVQYRDNPQALQFLASIYWYTAEVGLIFEDGRLKYYGGSIISSANEIATVYGPASEKKVYLVEDTGHTPYDSFAVNNSYYSIRDMGELNQSLSEIALALEYRIALPDSRNAAASILQ